MPRRIVEILILDGVNNGWISITISLKVYVYINDDMLIILLYVIIRTAKKKCNFISISY